MPQAGARKQAPRGEFRRERPCMTLSVGSLPKRSPSRERPCRYGSMDAIHFNNDAFHLDTAGANWGYGLGAFLHLFFDLGLGNNPGNVPMNPVIF